MGTFRIDTNDIICKYNSVTTKFNFNVIQIKILIKILFTRIISLDNKNDKKTISLNEFF